jgi:hypothetical protein
MTKRGFTTSRACQIHLQRQHQTCRVGQKLLKAASPINPIHIKGKQIDFPREALFRYELIDVRASDKVANHMWHFHAVRHSGLRVKSASMGHVILTPVHHNDLPSVQDSQIRNVVFEPVAAAYLNSPAAGRSDLGKDVPTQEVNSKVSSRSL